MAVSPEEVVADSDAIIMNLRGEIVRLMTIVQGLTDAEERRTRREAERLEELERLRKLVTKDHLTGLLNLRGFEEALEKHLAGVSRDLQSNRPITPAVLVYLDLGRFKPINDILGHQIGNRCLMKFAHAIVRTLRPTDIVGRLGGDEFAVLLTDVDQRELAKHVVAKLYRVVAKIRMSDVDDAAMGHFFEAVGRRQLLAFSPGYCPITDAEHSVAQVLALAEEDVPKFHSLRYAHQAQKRT